MRVVGVSGDLTWLYNMFCYLHDHGFSDFMESETTKYMKQKWWTPL